MTTELQASRTLSFGHDPRRSSNDNLFSDYGAQGQATVETTCPLLKVI